MHRAGDEPIGSKGFARPNQHKEPTGCSVVEFLSGKSTVDHVAFRFGVHPKTVEKWREVALEGIEQSMRQGTGKSKAQKEL